MIHLHTRSSYSLLESPLRIERIIELAKMHHQKAVVLTDHVTMYGTMAFLKAAKKEKIKPIIGLEFDVIYDNQPISLLALAKNTQGLQALFQISTYLSCDESLLEALFERKKENYDFKINHQLPFEFLNSLGKDLILMNAGGDDRFNELIKDIDFGSRFYQALCQTGATVAVAISLMDTPTYKEANYRLRHIALRNTLLPVALSRIAYEKEKDVTLLYLLQAIAQNKLMEDPNFQYSVRQGRYWRSLEEMENDYSLEELENTEILANLVEEYDLPKACLPTYPTNASNSSLYLKSLCLAGLQKRLGSFYHNQEVAFPYTQRLTKELDIILKMGFADYFLIVWDFIKEARKRKILAGPGRGSAAGSLVAWCLGITHIDPVANHLLFERFLNPERISMPDIDVDFPDDRRMEIIDYVQEKYGKGHVSHIVTFARFKAKLALRDTAHALNVPLRKIEKLTTLLKSDISLLEAYQTLGGFSSLIDNDPTLKKLYNLALQIEGLPRHPSIHAGGIVLSKDLLIHQAPLIHLQENLPVVQFSMDYLEDLGLIKFDFLAVHNLTILNLMIQEIKKQYKKNIDLFQLPKNDPLVYQLLTHGDTLGIFQLESAGIRNLIMRYKPQCFEDIAAVLALYRPGPMKNIDLFLKARFDPNKRQIVHPLLEPILYETGGIFVYQEQIMEAAKILGGFSLAQADILRKAMSKKQGNIMESWRKKFVLGAKEQGLKEEQAQKIFEIMEQFAQYGFNKSHSYAYGLIVYQMTWVKVHFPLAFYLCSLNGAIGSVSKIQALMKECMSRHIELLGLSLNFSQDIFVCENGALRLPLSLVQSIGTIVAQKIMKERLEHGPFQEPSVSIVRLFKIGLSLTQVKNLINAGALDELGPTRESLGANLEKIHRLASLVELEPKTNTWDFRGVSYPIIEPRPHDPLWRLEQEKKLLGFYWTRHPSTFLRQKDRNLKSVHEILAISGPVQTIGILHSIHFYKNKKGQQMAFGVLSDESGEIDLALMPWIYEKYQLLLKENQLVYLKGNKNRPQSILVNVIQPINEVGYSIT